MKIRWGAWPTSLVAILLVAMLGGCGPRNVEDTYSFGTARLYFGQSAVELLLPFELQVRREAELQAQAPQELTAYNANAHFQTIVEAAPAVDAGDVAAAQAYLVATLQDNAGAVATPSAAQLAGRPAARVDYTYTQPTKNGPVPLTGRAYIVVHDGTLWRIMYQYPTGDAEGEALLAAVDGQVQWRAVNKERI